MTFDPDERFFLPEDTDPDEVLKSSRAGRGHGFGRARRGTRRLLGGSEWLNRRHQTTQRGWKAVKDPKSVPRFIYWGIGFVLLVAAIIAALKERHGPGGAWWVLLIAFVVIIGLLMEHVRRITMPTSGRLRISRAQAAEHSAALATAKEGQDAELLKSEQSHLDMERTLLTAQRERQSRDAQIEALQQEPVGDTHRQRLQRIAASVRLSVRGGRQCEYEDPNAAGYAADPRFKESLRIHSRGCRTPR